jgi:hypothetical protein
MAWHPRVLVVANVTATAETLIDALKQRAEADGATFTLLMPSTHPGMDGRRECRPRLDEALAAWREAGIEAEGTVGDDDPVFAVRETWDPQKFDEIIVSTLPGQASKWLRFDLPHRVAAITDAKVTHVIGVTHEPAQVSPPPHHERPPLGPLSVLAWGGRPGESPRR